MEIKNNKINMHYLIWYFVIFSIIGLIIETIFCYITTGVIESRKGLLIGPFCPIYGVGAVCLICILNKYKGNDLAIFVLGGIAGSTVEYILSYALEAIYGARFWDYDYTLFNLNGRICLTFTIYWSILSIILMKYIKLKLDNYIEKIAKNKRKLIDGLILIFLLLDALITIWSVEVYQERVKNQYEGIYIQKEENIKIKIEEKCFSNEIMLKTFPNLRTRDKQGNVIFIRDLQN